VDSVFLVGTVSIHAVAALTDIDPLNRPAATTVVATINAAENTNKDFPVLLKDALFILE